MGRATFPAARLGRVRIGDATRAGALLIGLLMSGCISTIQGGPDRLYSVDDEVARARILLDGSDVVPGLVAQYYAVDPRSTTAEDQRRYFRNEIVARRMYVIDVEYSEYEANLTSERQKFGFVTTTGAAGLGIASTMVAPVQTARILSGVGAGLLAAKGAYDSEIVIAKTLQIVQGYMRAQRDNVASRRIIPRLNDPTTLYPLSSALHDLEDYYRAGTFTAGLIPALQEAGGAAQVAADEKTIVIQGTFDKDDSSRTLLAFLKSGGDLKVLNSCMPLIVGRRVDGRAIISNSTMVSQRISVIACARARGARL